MSLKQRANELKIEIPAVFLALKDKETPLFVKLLAGFTVAYALSPIDLVPDFIPVLGYLDDVIILPAFIAVIIRLIPKDVWQRCKENSKQLMQQGLQKKWYYALPIIFIWILILFIIILLIRKGGENA